MNLYFDHNHFRDFINIVTVAADDNLNSQNKRNSFWELGLSIRRNCQIQILPECLSVHKAIKKKLIRVADNLDELDNVGRDNDNKTEERRKREKALFKYSSTLKDRMKSKTNDKGEFEKSLPLSNHENPFIRRVSDWLRFGDALCSYYSKEELPTKILKYTSFAFSDEQIKNIDAHYLDIPIKQFLNTLLINGKNLSSKTKYTGNKVSWSELVNGDPGLTEIIIVDPYFFTQEYNNFESSYKLISELINGNQGVNVFIFCKSPELKHYKKSDGQEHDNISNFTNIMNGLCEKYSSCNFCIIFSNPWDKDRKLHDRYIITNFKLYLSGQSFVNYFPDDSSKNEAHGSVWFNVNTFVNIDNELILKYIIEDRLDKIMNDVKEWDCVCSKKDIRSNLITTGWKSELYSDIYNGMQCKIHDGKIWIGESYETKFDCYLKLHHGECFADLKNEVLILYNLSDYSGTSSSCYRYSADYKRINKDFTSQK